jgi:hypothetical protein
MAKEFSTGFIIPAAALLLALFLAALLIPRFSRQPRD